MALPWEKQKGESSKAFAAFAIYRDMGPERSTAKVAHACGKNKSLIDRWCKRDRWVERAIAWDMEQDRLKQQAMAEEIKAMAERHARLASAYLSKLVHRLQSIKPEELSPRDMAQWLDVAVKVERLSRGASTENVRAEHGGVGGRRIEVGVDGNESDEAGRVARILAILAEAGAIPAPVGDAVPAEDDEVHPDQADGAPDGVPPAGR